MLFCLKSGKCVHIYITSRCGSDKSVHNISQKFRIKSQLRKSKLLTEIWSCAVAIIFKTLINSLISWFRKQKFEAFKFMENTTENSRKNLWLAKYDVQLDSGNKISIFNEVQNLLVSSYTLWQCTIPITGTLTLIYRLKIY